MTTSSPSRLSRARSLAAGLLVAAVLAAGCGGDDDASPPTTGAESTSTTTAASTTTEVEGGADALYADHVTEVYDDEEVWMCRPDLETDACRDLDVTTVQADGTRSVEERSPDLDAPVDCFYVYPTVSDDEGINSDLEVAPGDPEELTVIAQAAQYARSCRVFAPVYRQVTLVGLGEGGFATGGEVAYADVLDAWKTYMSTWNEGRGVILIGHSQGAGILAQLLAEEVDTVPEVRERLVAAHLFGGAVRAPEGADVGGDLAEISACREATATGCVVTWSAYPATDPPVPAAIFGSARDGDRALCTDAVGLLGRARGSAVAPVSAPLVGGIEGIDGVDTRFVALPEAVEVSCEATADHDYLAVGIDPADTRPLDGLLRQRLGPTWGLHLVDMTVALDDLVELARVQAEAFTA